MAIFFMAGFYSKARRPRKGSEGRKFNHRLLGSYSFAAFCKSQRILRGDELPRQLELFRELRGEGLHGVDFRGIVAAAIKIQLFLLGAIEPFLAELAGYQRIY